MRKLSLVSIPTVYSSWEKVEGKSHTKLTKWLEKYGLSSFIVFTKKLLFLVWFGKLRPHPVSKGVKGVNYSKL